MPTPHHQHLDSEDFTSDDEINPRPCDSSSNINNIDILEVEREEKELLLGRREIGLLTQIN